MTGRKRELSTGNDRDETIAGLIEVRGQILEQAGALPEEKHDQVFLGMWSVKDLIAHLEGWDEANRRAVEQILAGKLPGFYEFADKGWKSFNARLVAKFKLPELDEMLRNANRSHQELIAALRAVPPEDWDRDRGIRYKGWKVTIARLMKAELSDERKHLEQLREFVEEVSR
jgi:DinB superfamily